MDNPIQVCVGTLDLAAVHSITQYVEIIAEEDKRQRVSFFQVLQLFLSSYFIQFYFLVTVDGFYQKSREE